MQAAAVFMETSGESFFAEMEDFDALPSQKDLFDATAWDNAGTLEVWKLREIRRILQERNAGQGDSEIDALIGLGSDPSIWCGLLSGVCHLEGGQ